MADFRIDESTEFGARAAAHLRDDVVAWLTTVTPSGAPLPSPVWLLWDGADGVLMFSKPTSPRMRNLAANPKVSLNFRGDELGGDIVMLSGTASTDAPYSDDEWQRYVEKYAGGIRDLGSTPEDFHAEYSAPVRITLTKLRGY